MATRYKAEIERLDAAYYTAMHTDISFLTDVIERWRDTPMAMIGSGGSFSTASFVANLHESTFGIPTKASTPLELTYGCIARGGVACFTASGRNRDIGVAFKSAAQRELKPLSAVVMTDDSPIHALGRKFAYSDIVGFSSPNYRDGFLAVASMIATSVMCIRAYQQLTKDESTLPYSISELMEGSVVNWSKDKVVDLSSETFRDRTVSLLYTNSLHPTGVDLESRFVEAGLGNLHIADLRNFGHGRHFWMAKHPETTAILALVGDEMGALASRTLSALPTNIPVLRLDFTGPPIHQSLAGLIAGLYVSLGAGVASGIDPGKPGVPEFGRRLYRIGPPRKSSSQKNLNQTAAINRKSEQSGVHTSTKEWVDAYDLAFGAVTGAKIDGIVLDYDGTLCDERQRFDVGITEELAEELSRLLGNGLPIGIATGRGPSAGQSLRKSLPKAYWGLVTIGYYNGAVIETLQNEADPLVDELESQNLVIQAIRQEPFFVGANIRSYEFQITLKLGSAIAASRAYAILQDILRSVEQNVRIVSSSQSIDILMGNHSKTDVVEAVAKIASSTSDNILRIGDRGAKPGNDFDLLNHPLGLSVDQTSNEKGSCWNLSPAGLLGVQATHYLLKKIKIENQQARLVISKSDRG